jgi:GNAT superfamily N-acetyltransferase
MIFTHAARATSALSSDVHGAVSALTLAFASDPVCRWLWADPGEYLSMFPRFVKAFGGKAFERESAFVAPGHHGAALWLPPGEGPDEPALVSLIEAVPNDTLRSSAFELLESMGDHHPQEPHWYLPLIGVEPAAQSRGLGHLLMAPVLHRCDASRLPAYLESTNPRNLPFYERLGFRATGCIDVGDCPPIFPMLRRPSEIPKHP